MTWRLHDNLAKLATCLFVSALMSNKGEAIASSYYRAAVVEHPPTVKYSNPEQNLRETIDQYEFFIEQAHSRKVDIIVFPEAGLFGTDFSIFHDIQNFTKKREGFAIDEVARQLTELHIGKLSTYARDYSIYIAVTILEKYPHSKNEIRTYITVVVFDRQGVIVSCYRKFHLFGEPVSGTNEIRSSFFDSDFGVRFGLLIGLDILYEQPALTLMKELNVTDFIYSSQWFSELPFLTAVQAQWMWSIGNDVNLIAAGLNCMERSSSGSGIYRGKNSPVSRLHVLSDEAGWTMIIGNVTKGTVVSQKHNDDHEHVYTFKRISGTKPLRLVRQNEVPVMTNANIKLPLEETHSKNQLETNFNRRICHESLCCSFNLTMSYRPSVLSVRYKAVVYDGSRTSVAGKTKLVQGVQLCGIVLCSNDSISSCGSISRFHQLAEDSRLPAVNFTNILITANFTTLNSNVYPNILLWPSVSIASNTTDFLIDPRLVNFSKNADNVSTLSSNTSMTIISCSIFSRVFSRDFHVTSYDADRVIDVDKIEFPSLGVLLMIIFYASVFYIFFIRTIYWHECKIYLTTHDLK